MFLCWCFYVDYYTVSRSSLLLASLLDYLLELGCSCIFSSCPVNGSTILFILEFMHVMFWYFDVKIRLFLSNQICQNKAAITIPRVLFLHFSLMFFVSLVSLPHVLTAYLSFNLECTIGVYLYFLNRCCMFSSAWLHRTHDPGPLHPFRCKLSRIRIIPWMGFLYSILFLIHVVRYKICSLWNDEVSYL